MALFSLGGFTRLWLNAHFADKKLQTEQSSARMTVILLTA